MASMAAKKLKIVGNGGTVEWSLSARLESGRQSYDRELQRRKILQHCQ
jgi:hypothetical protein